VGLQCLANIKSNSVNLGFLSKNSRLVGFFLEKRFQATLVYALHWKKGEVKKNLEKVCQMTKAVITTDKRFICFLWRIQLFCFSHPNRI